MKARFRAAFAQQGTLFAAPEENGAPQDADLDGAWDEEMASSPEESVAMEEAETLSPEAPLGPKGQAQANIAAIETAKALLGGSRPATREENAALACFAGWGGCKAIFEEENAGWMKLREKLRSVLDEEEYAKARASIVTAYYTPKPVVEAMWSFFEEKGFQGGRVLEPALGTGRFLSLEPPALKEKFQWVGVELEPVTARIAQAMHPEAYVYTSGFEDVALPENSFDAVVTNVPFGNFAVSDPVHNPTREHIHNYFLKKSVALTKPGGIVAAITSTGTLQASEARGFRESLSRDAELLGAFRLPGGVFEEAGTGVSTDLLILRKRAPGETPSPEEVSWVDVVPLGLRSEGGRELLLNEYFVEKPSHLMGSLAEDSVFPGRLALLPDGRSVEDELKRGLRAIPFAFPAPVEDGVRLLPREFQEIPNYAFFEHEGSLFQKECFEVREVPREQVERVQGALAVHGALDALMEAELRGELDAGLLAKRLKLNATYDDFVRTFGAFHASKNAGVLDDDPRFPLLVSLEESWDKRSGEAKKAEIFFERTIRPQSSFEASTPGDALLVSLNARGHVDLEFMGTLLEERASQIRAELESQNLIFEDPETGRIVPADEYLSGNVREKLRLAREVGLSRHVAALEAVQPRWVLPSCDAEMRAGLAEALGGECELDEGLSCQLGVPWVEPRDVQDFLAETLDVSPGDIAVAYSKATASWSVEVGWLASRAKANTELWGTPDKPAHELVESALNLREPKVYEKTSGDAPPTVNEKETEQARQKQALLKERFSQWLWTDKERTERLTRRYNGLYNSERLREFDGRHLNLPGSSPEIELRPHQKNAVWRAVQSPSSLFAHCVGAGKTYALCASAMEMRRLKVASKPMLVVLPDTITDIEKSFRSLYPGAKLLVPGEKDFQKENRQKLIAKIATGNWDCVILTHPQFAKIKLSKTGEKEFIREEIAKLEDAVLSTSKRRGRLTKELERSKLRLETRIKDVISETKKDGVIDFEKLGVDAVLVDEAHAFKNLGYVTKLQNVKGLPNSNSQRAFDMYMKTRWLQKTGGRVVFATGTPVMNSIAEFYTLQRYLQPEALEERGLASFDSWAATFGEIVKQAELGPTGKYRESARFSKIVNLPELQTMFRSFADVQTPELLNLPRPQAEFRTEVVTPSEEQLAFNEDIVVRAEAIKKGEVKPNEDNYLKLTSDGRKAALDIRLVKMDGTNVADSKVNTCLRNVMALWQATEETRAAQAIFCDFSTPKGRRQFDAYTYLRDGLVALGVPEREVAFIHDCRTKEEKKRLFARVNAGEVRVVLGSTQKLGTGVNIQERLLALHNLDAPYRPADLEQRGGRIQRQGNRHAHVAILNYVTEGKNNQAGFDAFLWQTLETKAKFIDQIMTGRSGVRTAEDIDGTQELTYAQVKALASGDTRIIEKANVDAELGRLSRLAKAHEDEQFRFRRSVKAAEEAVAKLPRRMELLSADVERQKRTPLGGERFAVALQGTRFRERSEAGKRLFEILRDLRKSRPPGSHPVGSFGGFELRLDTYGEGALVLRGEADEWRAKLSESPHGTMVALGNAYERIPETLGALKRDLGVAEKTLQQLRPKVGLEFPGRGELLRLRERQATLESELGLWLDPNALRTEEGSAEGASAEPETLEDEPEGLSEDELGVAPYAPPEPEVLAAISRELQGPRPLWMGELLKRNQEASELKRRGAEVAPGSAPLSVSGEEWEALEEAPSDTREAPAEALPEVSQEMPQTPSIELKADSRIAPHTGLLYGVFEWPEAAQQKPRRRGAKREQSTSEQPTIFDFAKEEDRR